MNYAQHKHCLLYTSDAADDLLCVDLGGRRIIKTRVEGLWANKFILPYHIYLLVLPCIFYIVHPYMLGLLMCVTHLYLINKSFT